LVWNAGPGYYFIRRRDMMVGQQFFASGEYKDVDRFRSKKAEEIGLTSVFLGPRMMVSRGRFSAEVAAGIRLSSTTRHCKSCLIIGYAVGFRSVFNRSLRGSNPQPPP
jgi:hypothetical protein